MISPSSSAAKAAASRKSLHSSLLQELPVRLSPHLPRASAAVHKRTHAAPYAASLPVKAWHLLWHLGWERHLHIRPRLFGNLTLWLRVAEPAGATWTQPSGSGRARRQLPRHSRARRAFLMCGGCLIAWGLIAPHKDISDGPKIEERCRTKAAACESNTARHDLQTCGNLRQPTSAAHGSFQRRPLPRTASGTRE